MTLALGFIATSPGEQTQGDEAAYEFELVDVQPPDAYDRGTATEEPGGSNEDTSDEASEDTSDEESTEDSDAEDSEFTYENCAAAQADGAAPVLEGERGFGPHLDADNDGIGCEQWGTPSDTNENDQAAYENCAAARADGAAPVLESDPGFGPHLDADNDGIGCEQWGTPSDTNENDQAAYENCAAARADGAAPVLESDPGFGPHLDADNDGIGCE